MAKWIAGLVAAALAIFAAAVLVVDTDIGHRWVADRIADVRTPSGLRFSVGRIDGSLYSRATLRDLRVYDLDGLVFSAPVARLDWAPLRWFANKLDIEALDIPVATFAKWPRTRPSANTGPLLPDFDIRIGRLTVDRLIVDRRVTGVLRYGRVRGKADIHAGRALVDLTAIVQGSDTLRLRIDAEPDRDRFDIAVRARATKDGVLARLTGIARPLRLDVGGVGSWARWDGHARATAGDTRVIDLALGNRRGRYTLAGDLVPAAVSGGKLARLTTPRVTVNGAATLANRRLAGNLDLRSAALAVETTGTIDLGVNAFRNVRIRARLLKPAALFPNMTGRDVELRAILDGAFATAAFDYRLSAPRFAFDDTGFEQAWAAGKGRLSKSPIVLPVRFTAARVTGVGDVAGGILRNLTVDGVLRITSRLITGDDLRVKSDKLTGRVNLTLDLATGDYQLGINGALGRYLIPGLGVVDVTSTLRVVPGPGGHGTRVIGQGAARVVRLDNAFFRSLAGGLPRIATALERTPDGVMHFTNLVFTGPAIRLTGTGLRRRDGSFHFEGRGRQSTYGALTLKLDGQIDRPTIDLVLAAPNAAMGLADVRAHLAPSARGFAFTAAGGSRLGPFEAAGDILLPSNATAQIAFARLDVSGTRATGTLDIVTGGFAGRLALAGGGLSGELLFRPVGEVQRIEAHLDADHARLGNRMTVRQAHVDLVALLDPAGTAIEASAKGAGLARGKLSIARFAGSAKLNGDSGEIRAQIAGTRGRSYAIQSVIAVTPDSYRVTAEGTIDRRPIKLAEPAVITRDGDRWRLAQTLLTFSGGEAKLSGMFGDASAALDATVTKMPLSILDIAYPGLGLGGSASGTLSYQSRDGGAPTGRVDMTVRGLTRSGLLASSRPIDIGIAGVLSADRAGIRAVASSGGQTIGRAQALLSPLGQGDIAERLMGAGLFAQLRYNGPADTLWRLTGAEMLALSGPVAIGADVTGRVSDPSIRGMFRADGARIESATTGTVLTNVQASGVFQGSKLQIGQFAADAGKGGRVTGTGQFDFSAEAGIGLDLSLQASHAVLINRDDIGATVSGPLRLRSGGSGGLISGDVTLDRSRYRLGQATAASAVPPLKVREINLPYGGEEEEARPTPWRLDVHARAPNQLSVSGLGLSSEWSADLKIGGAPDNPAITGRADLVRGNYEFAGREFQLSRGVIRFGGEVPANPSLDIEANADSTNLNATIRVTGVALKPEISFTSVPALPQDELLSRLLFGTSITNLSAPEALQLAAAVAALKDGSGGLNPINAVRRAAGLDRLRILPADPQTGQQTSIAAGKYVTRKLYAEIITDGQGYSATRIEYQVTRWLSLLSTISTLGRQSVNVRVSKDY